MPVYNVEILEKVESLCLGRKDRETKANIALSKFTFQLSKDAEWRSSVEQRLTEVKSLYYLESDESFPVTNSNCSYQMLKSFTLKNENNRQFRQ